MNNKIIKGITAGAFDLFHAGHVLMLQEAKTVCDYLIVCIQTNPAMDRPDKNAPVQSLVERQIQVEACRYVDHTIVYETEAQLVEILKAIDWDIRIIGDEYRDKPFTGREFTYARCHFNKRPHTFSSSELRQRIANSKSAKSP